MANETSKKLKDDIWSICNLLRGPYKRNEYRKVILPLTVLRRFDCILAPTKPEALKVFNENKAKPETVLRHLMRQVTGKDFYNLAKFDLKGTLADTNQIAPNLNAYINAFSPNVREIMQRFDFGVQIAKMAEKDLIFEVIQKFCTIDLSEERVKNDDMGYIFEELIRIGAEQSNEEAGEHFTPREVIKLMVNLLLNTEKDLAKDNVVKTIYDPACGTGGMLSIAEEYLKDLNNKVIPKLYGQDWNDESYAICRSDMLIKGEDAENIALGDTFTKDAFRRDANGQKITFDYMLANPPFGVEWKQQKDFIEREAAQLGYNGRFGAGTPRINDGALLFLQHMIDKMRPAQQGGSRIGIIFNGSPLFTGDAGSGESEIRRWIIEKLDLLEAIVALPEQLFYNTGIATYIWILSNRKENWRKGKVQLIDARSYWEQMDKSLGNKRRRIGDPAEGNQRNDIGEISQLHYEPGHDEPRYFTFRKDGRPLTIKRPNGVEEGTDGQGNRTRRLVVSKIYDNADFGYRKITVERPLRLNFQATDERIERIELESAFQALTKSTKKNDAERLKDKEAGQKRQQEIRDLLAAFQDEHGDRLFMDRLEFLKELREVDRAKGVKLAAPEIKAVLGALGEQDEDAEVCKDRNGNPEPDTDLRDTETVPLKEDVEEYFKREVLPHIPDAWIDHSKTKIGYEIPFNREFYVYEPPRSLDEIEQDIEALEDEIIRLLREVRG
ncbi:MAG: SAM-dependent DNA methyltransferase [Fimbriimonadaceae bacterium]|nr:SAM-dependent DNA methyltransferase [Fimbriimonadaceae bacterium]